MEEGWIDFILGNEIKQNDFLLFHCKENTTFTVQVFKPCGIERIPETQTYQATTDAAVTTFDGKKKWGKGRPKNIPK